MVAQILVRFKITPKTIASLGSRANRGATAKGYKREQFEQAWKSYCRPSQRLR
jgi:hypothetical protein